MRNIYENEEIVTANGFPSLVRFYKGDSDKPLVVFFPGWSHLGRISYGFPGCDEKQFLAYWVRKKGFSFLAISYPMDHSVYDEVYPDFTLTDWGEMAAGIVVQFITDHKLKNEVIGVNWSAAGQAIRPFSVSCQNRGINHKFTLGIEATPGLQIPSDRKKGQRKTKKNMVSIKSALYDLFWREIQDQSSLNNNEIMTKKEYYKYFLGDIPIGIAGTNEFFVNGEFVDDPVMADKDKGFFSFTEYPMVAIISGNSTLVPYHPIVDKYTWGFLMTRKIYHGYIAQSQSKGKTISESVLNDLLKIIDKTPKRLSGVVPGNHFLFVGKNGAKSVANCLGKFDVEIEKIKAELSGILK